MTEAPRIRHWGLAAYEPVWRAMQKFTDERQEDSCDGDQRFLTCDYWH